MIGPETVGERLGKLMRLAQCGDSVAYAELLNEITPLLRRLVRRQRPFLRPEDIEDLVQDTLLSMHSVRATYDAARPFLPWLFAINRNRSRVIFLLCGGKAFSFIEDHARLVRRALPFFRFRN